MCCGAGEAVLPIGGAHSCGCGCGPRASFRRRFLTKEERVQALEEYLADLQKESSAVRESIQEVKRKA